MTWRLPDWCMKCATKCGLMIRGNSTLWSCNHFKKSAILETDVSPHPVKLKRKVPEAS